MDTQLWSWILGFLGVLGFIFAGKKLWWAWYINIATQFIWFAYAIITQQYGFLVSSVVYFAVFTKNAYEWTKEHRVQQLIDDAEAIEKLKRLQETIDTIERSYVTPEQAREYFDINPEIKGGKSNEPGS